MSREELELERLIEENARLMASAVRSVARGDLVPDIEQEIRLALLKRLRSGAAIEHPSAYVYKVALTTARTMMKRQSSREESIEDFAWEAEPQPESEGRLRAAERKLLLKEVLSKLPKDQSTALRCYLAGLNHSEVASFCGWTESVARHRIYRALDTLRERAQRGSR